MNILFKCLIITICDQTRMTNNTSTWINVKEPTWVMTEKPLIFFSDRFSTIFFWHLSTNKGKYFIFSSWQQAGFIRLGNSLVVRNSYSQTVAHKHKWFWDLLWWKAPPLTALVDTSTAAGNAVRAAVMKDAVWIQRSSGWQQMFGFFKSFLLVFVILTAHFYNYMLI